MDHPSSVTEWPAEDVMQRKYQESIIFLDDHGTIRQEWIQNATIQDKKMVFMLGSGLILTDAKPLYRNIESGYYSNFEKNRSFLIRRPFGHNKYFKVGVHDGGWQAAEVNTGSGTHSPRRIDRAFDIDLGPPDKKEFATRKLGIINRRYFMSSNRIFWKGNQIGMRKDNLIYLDNPHFKKDLIRTLGAEWRVLSDISGKSA